MEVDLAAVANITELKALTGRRQIAWPRLLNRVYREEKPGIVAMTLYDHSDTVPSRKRRTGYMNGWMDEHLANKISIQGNVVEKVNSLFTTLLQDWQIINSIGT